jgi:hypothetical protein
MYLGQLPARTSVRHQAGVQDIEVDVQGQAAAFGLTYTQQGVWCSRARCHATPTLHALAKGLVDSEQQLAACCVPGADVAVDAVAAAGVLLEAQAADGASLFQCDGVCTVHVRD